jgi:hypothetical protein
MSDFVDALETELRRAAQQRAAVGPPRIVWPRPRGVLAAGLAALALAMGLSVVVLVRPADEDHERPAATTPARPAAAPLPADVSPGARRSKRFGHGARVGTSAGVPVYADIDRWRYCPREPVRLRKADVLGARRAVLVIVARLTWVDTSGARSAGRVAMGDDYAMHQCGSAMRGHAADVSIVTPQVRIGASSLGQFEVVVARTREGWVVFDRRH